MKLPHIPHFWYLTGPLLSFSIGILLNSLVMAVNNGQMPALWPGGCESFPKDHFHTCMNPATHLKFLADWIQYGIYIASPGDVFLILGDLLTTPFLVAWAVLVIHESNKEK